MITFSVDMLSPNEVKHKYGIPDKITLTVRLKTNGWFVATSDELPGLLTQAKTQEELVQMVNDAVLTYFDVPKKEADIVYDQLSLGGQVIQYRGQMETKAVS